MPGLFCDTLITSIKTHFETCEQCRKALAVSVATLPPFAKMLIPAEVMQHVEALAQEHAKGK